MEGNDNKCAYALARGVVLLLLYNLGIYYERLGGHLVTLYNIVCIFLKYVWVKKCVKMRIILFKNWKHVVKQLYQMRHWCFKHPRQFSFSNEVSFITLKKEKRKKKEANLVSNHYINLFTFFFSTQCTHYFSYGHISHHMYDVWWILGLSFTK